MNDIYNYLQRVQKPARYTGGEINAVMKQNADYRVCFCFPDTYEIGMSHLGLQILYGIINDMDSVWCERSFAPWVDMEAFLRERNLPLFALESGDPLSAFDVLAFTLQYEMSYANILNMLSMGNVPLFCRERDEHSPVIIAGGPCSYNPEPLADFIDIFVIGDGEDVTPLLINILRENKNDRQAALRNASKLGGVYVPSLYAASYKPDGTLESFTPKDSAPPVIKRATVSNLDRAYYPAKPIVANTETVHERVMVELFRGCIRGCRFCQAGFTSRPVRARSPQVLTEQAKAACENSGYEEIALTSLSTSDYPPLEELCDNLLEYGETRRIGLSLPSLRADSFSTALMERVQKVRKSGLTFAPEAGTARLRDVINKNLTEEALFNACGMAFAGGWSGVKLYFMLGLPTETDEDVLGITDLAYRVFLHWRHTTTNRARGIRVSASVSCFVPKPHTPFQWSAMTTRAELRRRIALLKGSVKKQVSLNYHDPDTSYWEAVLARGDRRMGAAIYLAWKKGARLDGWREHFKPDLWQQAFEEVSLDPDFYALRERSADELLPWAHIDTGVSPEFLRAEYDRALSQTTTADCRTSCAMCGACEFVPAAKNANQTKINIRLIFSKTGRARFISHLDLMTVFSRAFARAGLPLRFSQGFNPHAYISIAFPLSVGQEGCNEIADFGVTREIDTRELPDLLNRLLPEGIKIISAQEAREDVNALKWARYEIKMTTNASPEAFLELFKTPLIIDKRSKKSTITLDVLPHTHNYDCRRENGALIATLELSIKEPSINPENIVGVFMEKTGEFPYLITRRSFSE